MARKALAALLLCVTLAACSGSPGKSSAERAQANGDICSDGVFDAARNQRLQRSDEYLRWALSTGKAPKPETAAASAISRGDFRLIGRMTNAGVATEPYGARCILLGGLSPWMARVIDFAPDAKGDVEGRTTGVETFARAYNAAMLADKRYPFGDVCRAYVGPIEVLNQTPDLYKAGLRGYGYRELEFPPAGMDIWQAARRGSVARIRQWLKVHPEAIDRPDMFGLSPLAWAVAYKRWNAADFLINQGAMPNGSKCQGLVDRDSPMQIARTMRWSGMIWRMRALVTEDDFASLRELPRADDIGLDAFNKILTDLRGVHAGELKHVKFARHDMIIAVDENGKSLDCRIEPASGAATFDAELCEKAIEVLHWTPARDAFGITVPADGKLILGIGDA